MKRIGAALTAALIALIAQPAFATQSVTVSVAVDCEKPVVLQVSVKNSSSERVTFGEFLLPWNRSKALRLEAFGIVDGKAKRLTGVAPVGDYLREISLIPKQVAKGKIMLSRAFAKFDEANKAGDILIFYRVNDRKLSNAVKFDGAAGVVLIPKKGIFTQECPALVRPSQ